MRRYAVKQGESPTMFARRHGVSLDSLLRTNPHKQTVMVAGQRTFKSVGIGEPLNVGVGDALTDAIDVLVTAGGPCLQGNAAFVCEIQKMLGVGVDGKWGSNTSSAARARVPSAPAACYPRPTWWAPVGQSSCPAITAAIPAPAPTAIPATTSTQVLAPAAVLALGSIDPCQQANVNIVCAAQKALGVGVDGKYGTATAGAAAKLFPGAPPACSPRPAWWAPVGQSNCGRTVTTTTASTQPAPVMAPTAAAVSPAVMALASINPCLQQNVAIVYAAQKALGVAADGKYGTATAAAAQRVLPGAPAACSPRPTWWAPVGQVNPIPTTAVSVPTVTAPSAVPATRAPSATTAPTAPAASTAPTASTTTTTSTTEVVTAPTTPKKLSTGAMVGIGLGAAALVGLVALAASPKHRRAAGHAARKAHRTAKKHYRKARRHISRRRK